MSTHNLAIAAYTADPWESACPVAARWPRDSLRISTCCGERTGPPARLLTSAAPIAEADLVVIQRDFPRYVQEYELVISEARRRRRPIVYELDDLILDLPADHPDLEHYRAARLPMLRAIMEADLGDSEHQWHARFRAPPFVHRWNCCQTTWKIGCGRMCHQRRRPRNNGRL